MLQRIAVMLPSGVVVILISCGINAGLIILALPFHVLFSPLIDVFRRRPVNIAGAYGTCKNVICSAGACACAAHADVSFIDPVSAVWTDSHSNYLLSSSLAVKSANESFSTVSLSLRLLSTSMARASQSAFMASRCIRILCFSSLIFSRFV